MVHQGIRSKLDVSFDDLGPQRVKNIGDPVRAFQILAATADPVSSDKPEAVLPLPDKPSIAVLPFTNMSGDPDQEYFSDGVTEDIITELSRFHSLSVVTRNSSFRYKGQAPKVQDIGRELGIRYVLQGSVRKASEQVRITATSTDKN